MNLTFENANVACYAMEASKVVPGANLLRLSVIAASFVDMRLL